MKKEVFSAKTKEEAKEVALQELNLTNDDVIFIEKEEKKSLFSKKTEIEVITKEDLIKYVKEFLTKITSLMGVDIKIEYNLREEVFYFNIITNNAPILIGKNGRTIEALQVITNQMINNEIGSYQKIQVDVSDYKKKRQIRLEKLAKYTAKDVAMTKCSIKLDPMNAYERRIIHSTLTNSTDVKTTSVGEEPNRCVVIEPKED